MIDLVAYYKRHHSGYYDKFAPALLRETYVLTDAQEVVDTFRVLSKPPSDMGQSEADYFQDNQNRFILVCFWLYKHGYTVQEFPNLLSRPVTLRQFAYDDIRSYLKKRDNYSDGSVPWRNRRALCDSLNISSSNKFQDIPDGVDETVKAISTRGAEFDAMELDERLGSLNNLMENLLKRNGKFVGMDYSEVFFGYFDGDDVKGFRKKTHCFRHGDAQAVADRKKYSSEEKALLVDVGVFMAVHIYKHLNKEG